jgi:Bardet-Biedl syndrome 2 protein
VKTKNVVTAIGVYDMDSDGVPEVISGWNNGMLNVRNCENGETVYKESMGAAVSSLLKSDYRLDGKEELMVCLESGEVRGYLPADGELFAMNEQGVELAREGDQKAIEELQAQKLELNNELRHIEKSLLSMKDAQTAAASGGLPGNTTLNYSLYADEQAACVSLKIEASTDVTIANIIAIDLGMWLHFMSPAILYVHVCLYRSLWVFVMLRSINELVCPSRYHRSHFRSCSYICLRRMSLFVCFMDLQRVASSTVVKCWQ